MIFLDTDTLSYFLSGNPAVIKKVKECINSGFQICLTCINTYEIIKGLKYKENKNKEREFYKFATNITTFSFDNDAIQKAADIYSYLRKKGLTIGDADILIASIVITNGGKLITNNNKHYQYVNELIVENWYKE